MLAPVSDARRDGRTSFRALAKYMLTEIDPESGKQKFRGDYLLSDSLLSLETAHVEMRGVAVNNPRVSNPVFHYQIAWPENERPSKEQWEEAVQRTIKALGFD